MNTDFQLFHMSDFLFARPSFLAGFGSIIDVAGTLVEFNGSIDPTTADYIAIRSDWETVGTDILEAMREFDCPPASSK
jgi:hypothetical protein